MATMQDVARLAGVSLSTVSYAVNKTKPVAPATLARIESAMLELGYRRNVVARALASRRTRIIALLFPFSGGRLAGTALEFVTSAAEAAREEGYHLVLWPLDRDADGIRELVDQGLVDGVITMEVTLHDERVQVLRDLGLPMAMIGRIEESGDLPYADIDFEGTVSTAIEHLRSLGHRGIAFINSSETSYEQGYGPTVRSERAYLAETERLGETPCVVRCDETPAAGRVAATQVLVAAPDVTAILVVNEHAAFGVVLGLRESGRQVPRDVSVLSLLSSPEVGQLSDPPLTTMHSPGVELGRAGVQALIDQLEKRESSTLQVLLPCRLRPGGSVTVAHGLLTLRPPDEVRP